MNSFFILIISVSSILGNEDDPQATLNSTNDNQDSHFDDNDEQVFSSSTVSEKVPDSIGMPQPSDHKPPHPHQKHNKNPTDDVRSHTRSPVYEVVNQPCYSAGCGGYGPGDGYPGARWQPGRNRYGPYPKYYEPRRRGGYRQEYYPQPGYGPGLGPNYGPSYPDYGYGPRGAPAYPRDRFGGGYGGRPNFDAGYSRPLYDDYFLG